MGIRFETILDGARAAALEAGGLLLERLGGANRVEHKGAVNLVTEADRASEALVVDRLTALLPEASVLAEEGTEVDRPSPLRWIVDPLDGTTNYAHRYPVFCVSIALQAEGRTVLGVIHDPTRDETFTALRDGGAFRNGEPLRVSGEDRLDQAFLVTGFPYDVRESRRDNLTQFARFMKLTQALRRDGSAALNLAYVAAGRFDGYWEEKLHPWDVAAGTLMVEEAGGRVTGYFGDAFDMDALHLVASNGRIHAQVVAVLREIEASGVLPPLPR
jgi:myo-inositol-1(or 4)-monophosphatase